MNSVSHDEIGYENVLSHNVINIGAGTPKLSDIEEQTCDQAFIAKSLSQDEDMIPDLANKAADFNFCSMLDNDGDQREEDKKEKFMKSNNTSNFSQGLNFAAEAGSQGKDDHIAAGSLYSGGSSLVDLNYAFNGPRNQQAE